ncbi:single-stranded DNA-binding protein [Corynebacterium phoceense]|uniref:single-stranded DNA-binding protein n=1 Tax=Corynebacterium phoceense TaxID=1686286 RepID=UPI0009815383
MIDIITIAGGLTRDAELRFTSSGQAVTNFTLAQSDRYKDDQGEWQTKQALPVLECIDFVSDVGGVNQAPQYVVVEVAESQGDAA